MKVLVLRFSSIGDIVLTTPVIRCLKNTLPNCKIHYATKKQYSTLLTHNPYLNKIHQLESDFKSFTKALKAENFDLIIDLHNNIRTKRIIALLKVKSTVFNKLNIKKFLLVNLKINKLPKVHIVERYLETLNQLNISNDGMGLDYFINPTTNLIKVINEPYICVGIGGQHFTKKMPNEKLISILQKLKKPLVLLGGKEDIENSKIIEKNIKCFNLVGKTTLDESALLIKNCEQVLTHDTGIMHISAAFKKPIVSLWGNTIPEFGMTPYYGNIPIKNQIAEVKNLSCRPCSKIGFDKCPKGHFNCMNMQDENIIIKFLNY